MGSSRIIIALWLAVIALPPASHVNRVRAGEIVLHNAFPAVLQNFPERVQDGVDGYIATDDCGEMGDLFVLVRPGTPDVLVAVADCAWQSDVPYRRRMGYIADVDRQVWVGPEVPQEAELWPVGLRQSYLKRMERLR